MEHFWLRLDEKHFGSSQTKCLFFGNVENSDKSLNNFSVYLKLMIRIVIQFRHQHV